MLSLPADPHLLLHHKSPSLPPSHHSHPQQLPQHQQLTSYDNDAPSFKADIVLLALSNLKIAQPWDTHEAAEDMLMALAHQKYKAGNYNHALEHSLAAYPQQTDNLLMLGAIYYQLQDFDMCISKNEESIQFDSHFAECYGNMANAWKLRPNFTDAWSNFGSAYMHKGRFNEAAQCCRQALALNPRLVDAHSNMGNLMKAQGLVKDAYNCYVEALRIQPDFAIAWSNVAGLFMEAGDLNIIR